MDIDLFMDADVERYASVLRDSAELVREGDLVHAEATLASIAGEVWMGRLATAKFPADRSEVAPSRTSDERLRARVFVRDGFTCTACGGRAVPRCVLVAIHDLFPKALPYNANYKRGFTHPVFWLLAPEADHKVAHSRGGENSFDNLTTLHAACNTRKSDAEFDLTGEPYLANENWDGLISAYPALVAAGAGAIRPAYHRGWLNRYTQAMAELGATPDHR